MALVKNDFVEMDWDARYFATKNRGTELVYAGQVYGGRLVLFRNGIAFLYQDTCDDSYFTPEESIAAIKQAYKDGLIDYLDEFSEYVEIADLSGVHQWAESHGFNHEEMMDIAARLEDLSNYWVEIEESIL